jgi:hypothetical protein
LTHQLQQNAANSGKYATTAMASSYKPILPEPPSQSGLSEAEKEIAWEEHSFERAKKRDEAAKAEAEVRGVAEPLEKDEKAKSGFFRIWRR